jgi:DedD protein
MAAGGNRGGAGERVLESRHVIGLFMAVLVLSGLFFTLGYVMGRNQSEGQLRAANLRDNPEPAISSKQGAGAKRASKNTPADTPPDSAAPENSEWEFYHAGDRKKPDDRLKPAAPAPSPVSVERTQPVSAKTPPPRTAVPGAKSSSGPLIPGGTYVLQVAALTKESDALDVARQLQKKKFPAFVLSPQTDKYYRVQVGPYADQKAADAARKGLEGAGFKAFVKH